MKLNFTKLVPVGALLCIVFASCQKNQSVSSPAASPTSSPLTRTTNMIGAMGNESDVEMSDILVTDKVDGSDCPTVTYNGTKDVYPYTKIVDYGTGCIDKDGITRKGKRFATFYADKFTASAGKVISVTTFSNYYVNDVSVSGDVKVSVGTPASSGSLVLKVIVNKTVTDGLGNTSSYVNISTQKQIEGNGTTSSDDDVYQIFDNSYGTEVSGDSAMITWKSSTDPSNVVINNSTCQFRSKGALVITLKQLGVQTDEYLDYGNGDCDDQATLTIDNGTPQTITLPFFPLAGEF